MNEQLRVSTTEVAQMTGLEILGSIAMPDDPMQDESSEFAEDYQSIFPDESERPQFVVFDDWEQESGKKYRPGVYYCFMTKGSKNNPSVPRNQWICGPLHIDALTRDAQDNNFGRLLRFKNSLNVWRQWAMPMELLRGDGADLRGELLAMGLEMDSKGAREHLPSYLQNRTPKRRMLAASQTGWAEKSFVLPDEVIGPTAAAVTFQSGERGSDEHTRAGNLSGWREGIAAKAQGNSLLLLALSAAFAGPLLAKTNSDGGGVHFVGDSSTGKTTAIEAACSVWGGENYKRSWRATSNGMEGAAATFNDCLLALDEISECDPKDIGAIVYSLGNGRGKQRASRTGTARSVVRWRVFVLSSGERTMKTAMEEGGYRAKAGQAVRLLDIPANRQYGAWDTLHNALTAAGFSDALKRAAKEHHGHAGRAFLEKLTRDERDLCAYLEQFKALPSFATDGVDGQPRRAAARFALIGLAGELATEYGVTGWAEGDAIAAAAECFKLWLANRGQGNDERRQIAEKLASYLERHGDGRFTNKDGSNEVIVRDRAGWWQDSMEHGREYLIQTSAMREALVGFDFKRSLDVLQEIGALPAPAANGERAKAFRIDGRAMKLYPVRFNQLSAIANGA